MGRRQASNQTILFHARTERLINQPTPIKTAVIGASGFIGRHLHASYRQAFPDAVGTGFSTPRQGLHHFDIRQPDLSVLRLAETGHRALLIASAKPNIDFCERERDAAYDVNVRGTLDLVRQAAAAGLQVIFFSTDYVFEGTTGAYDDDAPTKPGTEYGRQKAFVEKEIPSLTDNYLILRLSKIFGLEKGDRTLLDDIASSLAARCPVRVAHDQIFSPTYVGDVVRAVHAIQARGLRGTLNVCHSESSSRHKIAQALAAALGVDSALVQPVKLHDIPAMANRPLNTSMTPARFQREVALPFKPMSEAIAAVTQNWKS